MVSSTPIRLLRQVTVRAYSTVPEKRLIYSTPNATLVKLAKLFSLSTLGISSISTPAVMYFWEIPAVQATGLNGYMFLGALIASTCSTGALHYLLSPFINSIYLHTTKSSVQSTKESITPNTVITLETLDLFARRRQTTLPLRDLVPSSGLLLTWTVNRKVIERQYAEERLKGVAPTIKQTRFWLDRRNGVGDAEAMSQVLRVIQENHRRRRVV